MNIDNTSDSWKSQCRIKLRKFNEMNKVFLIVVLVHKGVFYLQMKLNSV